VSYYNIDNSRLSKFDVKNQIYVTNNEGLRISNNFENQIFIVGNYIDRYILEVYEKDKLINSYNLLNGQGVKIPKIDYRLVLKKKNIILQEVVFDTKNKPILLHLDSYCLGDTIAWIGYIKDYYYKHKPSKLYVTNFWNDLFESPHPNIELIHHYDQQINGIYSAETLGYAKATNHNKMNLQEVMCKLMDIPYVEKRPIIKKPSVSIPDYGGKYVCITEHATDISKTWLYEGGWQMVVDYLNDLGYKVVVISKEPTLLKNIIDRTGDIDITERITDLLYSEFFIGLSSGLSWLAWALKKKVIMISGFTLPYNEFQDKQYRVINNDVCTGCWHNPNLKSKSNNNCPIHYNTEREHECSKKITFDMVKEKIDEILVSS